jgi:hypothetical protein
MSASASQTANRMVFSLTNLLTNRQHTSHECERSAVTAQLFQLAALLSLGTASLVRACQLLVTTAPSACFFPVSSGGWRAETSRKFRLVAHERGGCFPVSGSLFNCADFSADLAHVHPRGVSTR